MCVFILIRITGKNYGFLKLAYFSYFQGGRGGEGGKLTSDSCHNKLTSIT